MRRRSLARQVGRTALAVAAAVAMPAAANAQINWVDWISSGPGSVSGTMNFGGTIVGVTYTGPYAFVQTSGGTDYWRSGGTPWPAYDGINAPTGTDMIALSDAGTHRLTFSTPVVDLFMAFVSVGRTNLPVTYTFSSAISGVHDGQGHWGNGPFVQSSPTVLTGFEAHGYGKFEGAVASLSWTTDPSEFWHGFNVGATTVTPEPGTFLLLGSGLLVVGMAVRRRRGQS